jgi:hypothetical protein
LEKIIGTPSAAAARAAAVSASRWAISSTPTGDSMRGAGTRRPKSSTLVSRSETSRSIRGTIRQRSKEASLARFVDSLPAPAATYANACGDIDRSAAASRACISTGTVGRRPPTPRR